MHDHSTTKVQNYDHQSTNMVYVGDFVLLMTPLRSAKKILSTQYLSIFILFYEIRRCASMRQQARDIHKNKMTSWGQEV